AYRLDSAEQQTVVDNAAFLPLFAAALSSEIIFQQRRIRARIKWPNDLVYNGKKLGGHLIETQAQGQNIHKLVIGIGVNLNHSPILGGDYPATSLADLLETTFSFYECFDLGQAIFAYYKKIDFLKQLKDPEFVAKMWRLYQNNKLADGQIWSLQNAPEKFFLQKQEKHLHSDLYLQSLEIDDTSNKKELIEVSSSFHPYRLASMQSSTKTPPLLLLDIGNTRSKFLFLENAWDSAVEKAKILSLVNNDLKEPVNELEKQLLQQTRVSKESSLPPQQTVIYYTSVNPSALTQIKAALPEQNFIFIEVEKKPLHYRQKNYAFEQLGADRFFLIEAALAKVPRKQRFLKEAQTLIVIFSFGTALTVDFVTQNGAHIGGYIVPGLQGSLSSLSEKTARLPKLQFNQHLDLASNFSYHQDLPFGANTESAMLQGQLTLFQSFVMSCLSQAQHSFPELPLQIYCCGGDAHVMRNFFEHLKQQPRNALPGGTLGEVSRVQDNFSFDERLMFTGLRALILGGDLQETK
ncbi:MAG: type III pantothenate kinase, partial [Oligoflexales bacterium]|nr:type III pantothenate kinase [Oligoflexales bacterium]